jgi:hypothetical protein
MRDIKFRGMTKGGKFVYGSLIVTTSFVKHKPKQHTKYWIVTDSFGNGGWFNIRRRFHVLDGTVGQYTGKTDKNGKEIYEGSRFKLEGGRVVIISYHEPSASFDSIPDDTAENKNTTNKGWEPTYWEYGEVIK